MWAFNPAQGGLHGRDLGVEAGVASASISGPRPPFTSAGTVISPARGSQPFG